MDKQIIEIKQNTTIVPVNETKEIVPVKNNDIVLVIDDTTPKKTKKKAGYGIASFSFAVISWFSLANVGLTTSINIILTPIIALISLLFSIVVAPVSIGLSLISFFISLIFIILTLALNVAPQFASMILGMIDKSKNFERTMLGEFGFTSSKVTLITALITSAVSFVITFIAAIIPVIIAIIIWLAKVSAFFFAIKEWIIPFISKFI